MSFDYQIALWFYKPVMVGLLYGTIYFFLISPREIDLSKNYLKSMVVNSFFLISLLPITYFILYDYLLYSSAVSRLSTNYIFIYICCFTCFFTSLVLFGYIKLKNYSNFILSSFPKLSPISMFFDLNLYLLIFNAWLMTLYFNSNSPCLLLIALGFLMALMLSNLVLHFRQLEHP